MKHQLSTLDFMQNHLYDAVEPEYKELCEQTIADLEELATLREANRTIGNEKVLELADYEQREIANKTIEAIRSYVKTEDLTGLELCKELIKIDEDAYTEGLDDGRDLVRNELEPFIKALVGHVRYLSDNESFDYGPETYDLDYIEGRLTL